VKKGRPNNLGRKIRTQRKKLGMNGSKLARRLGVSRQYVSLIELGQSPLCHSPIIRQLARVLKLDTSVLTSARPRRKLFQPVRGKPLGTFLTRKRVILGLNQEEIAKRANIDRTTLQGAEAGTTNPLAETLSKLCRTLECEVPFGLAR